MYIANNMHTHFYWCPHTIFPEDKQPDDNIDDYYHKDGTHYSNYYTNDCSSIIIAVITGTYRISTYAKSHTCWFTDWYQARNNYYGCNMVRDAFSHSYTQGYTVQWHTASRFIIHR